MTDQTSTTTEIPEDKPTPRTRARSRTKAAEPTEAAAPADDQGEQPDAPAPRARTRRRSTAKRSDEPGDGAASDDASTPSAEERSSAEAPSGAEARSGHDGGEGPDVEVLAAADVVDEDEGGGEGGGTVRRRRRRRGGRRGRGRSGARTGAGDGAEAEADESGSADEVDADAEAPDANQREATTAKRAKAKGDAAKGDTAKDDAGEDAKAKAKPKAKGDAAADETEEAEETTGAAEAAPRKARSRSRSSGSAADGGKASGAKSDEDQSRSKGGRGQSSKAKKDDDEQSGGGGKGTTRLQARNRGRSSGRSRGKGGGRRPLGGVSEETRRAITEGPPRKMLVNFGAERTQVAVLEERTLVEHYVTRKDDVSYVGNIYLGRVQNVLPGMEAAFVDIGKGRNGVLYAGEVNYDEADLEGELPRIEDHLKPGQTALVQVTKDPMGTKGARLTQHLSIAGRYCVLAPGDDMLGISRKLTDEERERLRKILKSIKPDGFGLIVRTAAEGATQEQLEADVSRLTRIWDQVQTRSKEVKPLDAVYEEPHLVMRVIRDIFGTEFSDLVVDSEEMAEQIREYLADVSPEMVDKLEVHTGEENIFDAYEVTTQVRRALEKKVWLKSGGYLIIEKTEAMWVIDVNTGKFVGKDNLEETVLKNNLEAADEIARQLRLRDMGGIIVIDFVDMLVPANRDEVLKRFKRELARDKTKSRVMDISKLGLVQMTRKNVSQGLTETFTTTCDVCEGRGAKILDHAFH